MTSIPGLISVITLIAVSALNIGQKAPQFISDTKWLKGNAPVMEDSVTIVELWQSSCDHCRSQIPHLTALQETFSDLISIVALSPEPIDELQQFLVENRDDIGYSVGHISSEVASRFYEGKQSIPYAYIVDQKGILLWKGQPATMDEALGRIMEGTFDPGKSETIISLENALIEALKTNEVASISRAVEDLLSYDPGNAKGLEVGIDIAKYSRNPEYLKKIIDKVPTSGLSAVNANKFARMLISEGEFAYQYPEAALKFAGYGLAEEPENPGYMDTYARLFYSLGDLERAIEWETHSLQADLDNETYRYNLEHYRRLEKIRAAMEKNKATMRITVISLPYNFTQHRTGGTT